MPQEYPRQQGRLLEVEYSGEAARKACLHSYSRACEVKSLSLKAVLERTWHVVRAVKSEHSRWVLLPVGVDEVI